MSMHRLLIVFVLGILGLVVTPTAGESMPVRSAAENKAAAEADAHALLAFVVLPAGANEVATPPREAGQLLGAPPFSPATPNLVDEHAIWIVPEPLREALRWVRTHLPAQATSSMSGDVTTGPGVPENEAEAFASPPVHGILGSRMILLGAVRLPNGSTALRADAEVVWITPRSPSELVPAGAHVMRIADHTGGLDRPGQVRTTTITAPGKIAFVRRLLDALPQAQPGVEACPSDGGRYVTIMFYERQGASPFATAIADPEGCGGVALTIDGKSEPRLEGANELLHRIERQLGLRLLYAKR
jgi:hypothetical protein